MPENPETIEEQKTDLESPPPASQEGYRIYLSVTRDGYTVSEPEALPPAPQTAGAANEDVLPDLTSAVKQILAIVKENPVGEDEQANFVAGYESR